MPELKYGLNKTRKKDTPKQILRDAKTSHASKVEKLEADLKRARKAIKMVLDWESDSINLSLSVKQIKQLKDALE